MKVDDDDDDVNKHGTLTMLYDVSARPGRVRQPLEKIMLTFSRKIRGELVARETFDRSNIRCRVDNQSENYGGKLN